MQYPSTTSPPLSLPKSTEAHVYALFALAMGITVAGVAVGMVFAETLIGSGMYMYLLIPQLALIFTARWWVEKTPLNYLLFVLFPLCSGMSVTPLILMVLTGYVNGASILLNALSATAFTTAAAAVFARTTSWNLGVFGRALFIGLIGLIVLGVLQIFIPAFRSTQMELLISGAGIVLFAAFTAYDLQRISQLASRGYNPMMLAISLYLDIFNLFIYVLRFMLLFGSRR